MAQAQLAAQVRIAICQGQVRNIAAQSYSQFDGDENPFRATPQLFIRDERDQDNPLGWIYLYHSGWLDRRLRSLFGTTNFTGLPRGKHEASTYGPLNCLFSSIFPSDLCYIIKPQAILHGETPPENPGTEYIRTSSEGFARVSGSSKNYPDFTICKVQPHEVPNIQIGDTLLVVIEVKAKAKDFQDGLEQLLCYMTRAALTEDLVAERLYGVLIYGGMAEIFFINVRTTRASGLSVEDLDVVGMELLPRMEKDIESLDSPATPVPAYSAKFKYLLSKLSMGYSTDEVEASLTDFAYMAHQDTPKVPTANELQFIGNGAQWIH